MNWGIFHWIGGHLGWILGRVGSFSVDFRSFILLVGFGSFSGVLGRSGWILGGVLCGS